MRADPAVTAFGANPPAWDAALSARYRWACALDVVVRKPGNVSLASVGHGMQAQQFLDSAQASAPALCRTGASIGMRIEAAVQATHAQVGCNTNLGIVLLCAPLAAAVEHVGLGAHPAALQVAVDLVLDQLTVADAAAAFRGIALAQPGGLGRVSAQDVRQTPTLDLRSAMGLAADRDRIARQYRDGYAELFGLLARDGHRLGSVMAPARITDESTAQAVQRVFLDWLGSDVDSHIVRKHGLELAQSVLREAAPWRARAQQGEAVDGELAWAQWDDSLKARGLNPGTSADLTVATLFLAALLAPYSVGRP